MDLFQKADFPENAAYHASGRMSSTRYEVFAQSPLEFFERFLNGGDKGPTDAMRLGSLVHCLALEPHRFGQEYVVWSGQSRATKEGKIEWASVSDGKREPVKQADVDEATEIAACASLHLPQGVSEAAFYARYLGAGCQCKIDRLTIDGELWDLKTCGDLRKWLRDFENGALVFKDAFYRMVVEAATGFLPPPVRYLAVSTSKPYDVAIRTYSPTYYGLACAKIENDLERYLTCIETNTWPGIEGGTIAPVEVEPNLWAMQRRGLATDTLDDMFSDDVE